MAVSTLPQVLITHPGRQHSHQAAVGLAAAGMLAGYWSGVPSLAEHARLVPRRFWARYAPVPLPPRLVRVAPWTPAMRHLAERLPSRFASHVDFIACRLFDRWAAGRLATTRADAVIACEISAVATFHVARRRGLTTILDAPSIHHLAQDRVQSTLDSPSLHRRLARVKDTEVELADHVLTVSELARTTYLETGIAAERVHAVTLGADPAIFAAIETKEPDPRDDERFLFLFAGASIHRKGLDLLLQAFASLACNAPPARLRIVGPPGDASSLVAASPPGVEVIGAVDQASLAGELRNADCLVLPSRHDSYGMVVVEALASGTPVLVSDMVGAKDLVIQGVNGWTVPVGAVAPLADRMRWCVQNAAAVRAMRDASRLSARAATWEAYHGRLATLLAEIVVAPSSVAPAAWVPA